MAFILPAPSREALDLSDVLLALGDPIRRAVVVMLDLGGPGTRRDCSSFGLPVTKSTRTHHFRVLRENGMIHMEDLGNRRLTSLRRDDLDTRFPGLLDSVVAQGIPQAARVEADVLAAITR